MASNFDKFTERARKVLSLAQEEAQRFNHHYIGTEHLLLGLVREGEGVAARVLTNMGVELHKVRSAVEFIIGRGEGAGHWRDRADPQRQEGHRAGRRRGAPPRTTTTSAPSTCCSAWSARARASPPACWRVWESTWKRSARRSCRSSTRAPAHTQSQGSRPRPPIWMRSASTSPRCPQRQARTVDRPLRRKSSG